MAMAEEIERLARLRDAGQLSEEEFAAAKARVLAGGAGAAKGDTGTHRALWALVIVVVIAAGAALVMLDEIGRTLELIAGSVGLIAAAGGAVLAVTEDLSLVTVSGFGLAALAIAAVAFAAISPVVLLVAAVVLAVAAAWTWLGDLFTG